MAADLEPIDIDINMNQNVSEESDRASQGMQDMSKSSQEAIDSMQKDIVRLNSVVEKMTGIIAEQQKQMSSNNDMFSEAVKRLDAMQSSLQATKAELESYTEIHSRLIQATSEGADVTDLLDNASKSLSETEGGLIDNMQELMDTQDAVNVLLGEGEEATTSNTVANTALSAGIREVCAALGIENTLITRSVSSVKFITSMKAAWARAVAVLNTQLGISIGLSKALLATGIMAIIGAVALLVMAYKNWREAQEETNRKLEEEKKLKEELAKKNEEIAKSYGKMVASIEANRAALSSENISLNDKLRIIKKLQEQIPGYTAALDDEGNVIRENTAAIDMYLKSLEKSLKFKAAMKDLEELYAQIYELEKQPKPETSTTTMQFKGVEFAITDVDKLAQKHGLKNAQDISPEILEVWKKQEDAFAGAAEAFTAYGKSKAQQEIENVKKYIESEGLLDLDKIKQGGSSGKPDSETQAEKATKELAKKTAEYQKQIDAARIASIQEGAEKQREILAVEYKRTGEFIAQELRELEELEKLTGNPATEQRKQLEDLKQLSIAEYESKTKSLNEASEKAIREIFKEIDLSFKSELDNNLVEINRYYDDLIRAAKTAGATITQIDKINASRDKAVRLTKLEAQKRELDFENTVAMRRIYLSRKNYLFETDRRRDELLSLKSYSEKYLSILEEQYNDAPTPELANEIELAKLSLEEFNAELADMPANKLQEVLSGFKALANSLSQLGGDMGEIFSGIASQLDNLSTAFNKEASATDRISAGINGVVSLVNIVTSSAAKRKAAEKEYYRNSIALAHEYTLALNEQLRLQSEISGSGFINDYTGRIKDSFDAMANASREYQIAISKLSQGRAKIDLRNAIDWGNVGKGAASGAVAGAAIGSVIPVIGTAVGAVVGAVAGFFTGLFGGKKKKTEYAGLLDVFPELVDQSGNLNKELAQVLINTDQVDDNTKQLLQNALDWADAVEEANKQIREIVVDLTGDLGNSMKDAIVGAWKAGEDASKRMFEVAGDSLGNFVENLLYSAVFADVFKQFEDDLVSSLHPVSGDGDVLDDFDRFIHTMDSLDEDYIALLEAVKKRAAERGFDLWNDGERTGASAAGLERISQDSANELNGNFYALRQQVGDIRNLQKEAVLLYKAMQFHLARIEENTEFCRYLSFLEDIYLRGIKMRA